MSPISTTRGLIYLINLTTLERLDAQFVPMELMYSGENNLAEVSIINRNEPKFQHSGGRTTMPITLSFYSADVDKQDVIRKIKWLETLKMSDGYDRDPPKVKIVWGKFFRDETWLLKSIHPVFSLFNTGVDMLPNQCLVGLEFVLDTPTNRTWNDVLWPSGALTNTETDILNRKALNTA